jgi:hypothetical protein
MPDLMSNAKTQVRRGVSHPILCDDGYAPEHRVVIRALKFRPNGADLLRLCKRHLLGRGRQWHGFGHCLDALVQVGTSPSSILMPGRFEVVCRVHHFARKPTNLTFEILCNYRAFKYLHHLSWARQILETLYRAGKFPPFEDTDITPIHASLL